MALDGLITRQRLLFVTSLYNETDASVSAEVVEQVERCHWPATASDSHERVEVTPARPDATSTSLRAQHIVPTSRRASDW